MSKPASAVADVLDIAEDERLGAASDAEWLRFLLDEGLEALAAYKTIRDPAVRAMFIRLMKEAAQADRNVDRSLN